MMLNQIRCNTLELIKQNHSNTALLSTAIKRGKKLLSGTVSKQDIVDIGAIGLTLILKK